MDRDVVLLRREPHRLGRLPGYAQQPPGPRPSRRRHRRLDCGDGRRLLPRRPRHRLTLGALRLGIWWTWDERLTSTLILWLIYVSYLLLRNFSAGPQMRTISAVLAVFGYIDVPIVYMSTRWWRTQHPAPVFFGGPNAGIAPSMKPAVSWNIYAWLAWALLVVSIRYAVERRQQQIDEAAALRSLEMPSPGRVEVAT